MKTKFLDILCVDDNINDHLFVQEACNEIGLTVNPEAILDGEQAIEYLEGIQSNHAKQYPPPEVILLDLKMPKKDGFEVLEWLRRQPYLRYFIVIVFSCSKLEEDLKRAYDLGANAYLTKPDTMEDLIKTIKAIKAFWIDLNQQPYATYKLERFS